MIILPHAMAGAAAGNRMKRWWLALPVAFCSHFILDYIPHVEATAIFRVVKQGDMLQKIILLAFNDLLPLAILICIIRLRPGWKLMYGCAFAAILPDVIERIPVLGPWFQTIPWTGWAYSFHHTFHHSLLQDQWALGFTTQLIVVGISLWLLLDQKPAPSFRDNHKIDDAQEPV